MILIVTFFAFFNKFALSSVMFVVKAIVALFDRAIEYISLASVNRLNSNELFDHCQISCLVVVEFHND